MEVVLKPKLLPQVLLEVVLKEILTSKHGTVTGTTSMVFVIWYWSTILVLRPV